MSKNELLFGELLKCCMTYHTRDYQSIYVLDRKNIKLG